MPFLSTLGGGSATGFGFKYVGQGIVALLVEHQQQNILVVLKFTLLTNSGSNQTFSVSDGYGMLDMLCRRWWRRWRW